MKHPNLHTWRRTVDKKTAKTLGGVAGTVRDVWAAETTDGWTIAARLVPDENGNTSIGELRIYPAEDRPFTALWQAELYGSTAGLKVPKGGIRAALLRRKVSISRLEAAARGAFDILGRVTMLPDTHPVAQARTAITGAGFHLQSVTGPLHPAKKVGRGRPQLSDLEYARIARDYVNTPTDTIAELVRMWRRDRAWITSRISRARRYGFLTKASTSGVKGGSLTPKAEAVLAAERTARHGKKTRTR